MRIKITIHAENNILVLPLSYHHCLQALIYKMMGADLGNTLHNDLDFKLFVFSQLEGEYILDNKNKIITFASEVSFSIASLNDYILMKIMENCFKNKENYFLKQQKIIIDTVSPEMIELKNKNEYLIKTISPLTVHRTQIINDKRKTIYLKPNTEDFINAIYDNFKHKVDFYKRNISLDKITIEQVGKIKEVNTLYKNYSIIGYMGDFLIKCSKEQIEFLSDTGLGDKNSQGFGMFKVLEKKNG